MTTPEPSREPVAWSNGKIHPTGGYDKRIIARGDTLYFVASYLHRLDGPAVIGEDGSVQFWIRGQRLTEQEHAARTGRAHPPR